LERLLIGKTIVKLPSCPSTNDTALQMAKTGQGHEGTVIMTHKQTNGRGQMGNQWLTEEGKNLTFSIILEPKTFLIKDQFQLNILVSVAIVEALNEILGSGVMLKWPNDIYYAPKGMNKAWKLGGMLIENIITGNQWTHAILGIGLNINQEELPMETAISLRNITGKEFDLEIVLSKILASIEEFYLSYTPGRADLLEKTYYKYLFRYHQKAMYQAGDEMFEGTITGVDKRGCLLIEKRGIEHKFEIKEVIFVNI
jgi:BirA family transcriptional regulator, biotin operon repressor / biotin---[acetyl-CoA-carboxylase] ligase